MHSLLLLIIAIIIIIIILLYYYRQNVVFADIQITDHPRSCIVYNFGGICLSVCNTITLKSLDVRSSFSRIRYISRGCGSSLYIKVIGSRSRSQEPAGRKSLFPQCKTSIGDNSGSIKHRAAKFACSMRFLSTCIADRMA